MSESNNSGMAKIAAALGALSLVGVIILFFRPTGGGGESDSDSDSNGFVNIPVSADGMKIGFFLNDSLNARSLFVQDVQKDIDEATVQAEQKMMKKQKELENWQKGWDAKQPLLSTEQEKYMIEAQQKQQEAMLFEQNLQMELGQTQERLMITLVNRISMIAKIIAEKEGFDMIFSYQLGQNLIYIRPQLDITDKLCKMLDDDYKGNGGLDSGAEGQ